VGDSPLRCVQSAESSGLVACGSQDGTVTLLELSSSLLEMQGANEKAAMAAVRLLPSHAHYASSLMLVQLLERETSREKLLASRMRELSLQQRIKSARPAASDGESAPVEADEEEVQPCCARVSTRPTSLRNRIPSKRLRATSGAW
jgi:dynein intermediate chain 2